ncbi:MAG: four helix bundle protein, partial [Bacteroidales bacterium]|nr:four helix bundle protein [Bacteroidales bacterium]
CGKLLLNGIGSPKNTLADPDASGLRQLIQSLSRVLGTEGFGRYHKKDKIKFYRYSSGSIKESLDWNEKSKIRNLLTNKEYNHIFRELDKLPKELNQLIKYTPEHSG